MPTDNDGVPTVGAQGEDTGGTAFSRSISGTQPAPGGTFARLAARRRSLFGDQPRPTGTLSRAATRRRTLTGNQPAAAATLSGIRLGTNSTRALFGNQTNPIAMLTAILGLRGYIRAMAGDQPPSGGILSAFYVSAPAPNLPRAQPSPTVTIRVYDGSVRDGIRQRDLTIYQNAQFTRQRNAPGSFEIKIPLVPINVDLLSDVREGWLFEFWSESSPATFLFGGYVTGMQWSLEDGRTMLTVKGPSYLAWLAQRRIYGGTGSLPWKATLGGLETEIVKPALNQIMYHAMTYAGPDPDNPLSVSPPGTIREHPMFRIPDEESISQISDVYSTPTLPSLYGIPRPSNTEITAFMSGVEVLNYLSEQVGVRTNEDTTSLWFGMPRISYDIIRYDGPAVGAWPSNALYLVFRIPGLGSNRSVGSQTFNPVIFDVEAGGVTQAQYIEDSSEVKNKIITLGAGNAGTRARYLYSDADSVTRYGEIEDVVDAGQEGNVNVVKQKAEEVLNDKRHPKITGRFTVDPMPDLIFGYDFFFDDLVTVYWSAIGLAFNDFITAVTLSMGVDDSDRVGIQRAEIVVGSEKIAKDSDVLGRYLNGLKRGLTNIRI